jgi:hypothetical protein
VTINRVIDMSDDDFSSIVNGREDAVDNASDLCQRKKEGVGREVYVVSPR